MKYILTVINLKDGNELDPKQTFDDMPTLLAWVAKTGVAWSSLVVVVMPS